MPSTRGDAKAKAKGQPTPKAKQSSRRQVGKQPEKVPENSHEEEAPQHSCPEAPASSRPDNIPVYAQGEQSALLNALKYQIASKKTSELHKKQAEKILDEYRGANKQRKFEILMEVRDKGVKNLSWYHESSESNLKREETTTATCDGMLLASKIFEVNGITPRDLTPEEQESVLQGLLGESEKLFGHQRMVVEHTNPMLTRYFYKWNQFRQDIDTHGREERMTSSAEMKGSKLGHMLTDGPSEAAAQPSDSYLNWTSLGNAMKKVKMALTKSLEADEECQLFLPEEGHGDLSERKKTLQEASTSARKMLNAVRLHLAKPPQVICIVVLTGAGVAVTFLRHISFLYFFYVHVD